VTSKKEAKLEAKGTNRTTDIRIENFDVAYGDRQVQSVNSIIIAGNIISSLLSCCFIDQSFRLTNVFVLHLYKAFKETICILHFKTLKKFNYS